MNKNEFILLIKEELKNSNLLKESVVIELKSGKKAELDFEKRGKLWELSYLMKDDNGELINSSPIVIATLDKEIFSEKFR